ncbi:MAG: hypothetical protein ABR985_21535 [Methanotrichaceae archaeon]
MAFLQCSHKVIAEALQISEKEFSMRLKDDPELKAAMEKGQVRGRVKVKRALYRGIMNHHITICKECGKMTDDPFKFWHICPLCLSSNIKQSYRNGNPKLLKIFMQTFVDIPEKDTGSNDEEPFKFATLAEFSIHMANKHKAQEKEKWKEKRSD